MTRRERFVSIVGPLREFHVSKVARDRYGFADTIFSAHGRVVCVSVRAAREFAFKMNARRRATEHISAGSVFAAGLIDEIYHSIVAAYLEQYGSQIRDHLRDHLIRVIGPQALHAALASFSHEFPSSDVYQGKTSVDAQLAAVIDGVSGLDVAIEELLVLWLGNRNPACAFLDDCIDESLLEAEATYHQIAASIERFFADRPHFGPDDQALVDMLRTPAHVFPTDLQAQLSHIRSRWGHLLTPLLERMLRAHDLLSEERALRAAGPGVSQVLTFSDDDRARFSPDKNWMPRVVLLAKNTFVWLDQLSTFYDRPIARLDEIPNQELDRIAARGFTGLWLIGLWERSDASRTIKQWSGNPDATASAYSVYNYEIAEHLGGWAALSDLRGRLQDRGIRIASDMVPNHTGIDSQWIREHPDWFVSLPYSPFPSYSFSGVNLSGSDRVGVYLEDHYFDRSDAAVVFRRVDHETGDERYIYHGNDGTSMPWNDTAQLNYLSDEVREAVVQTILHVARNFSIIRFDAAMTLAKRQIQRLWFPEPGHGGAIPSRSEHGMSAEEFDRHIPIEFWREVVDRVAAEVPETLLLAEAFWMMEGFFVRTLGMHRVYNSAFMHMIKNEENQKYRATIKNTLSYDPQILQRFVNFMNNPDEETAIDQFGAGDKYFGVCTMMVTMPGLPMFGHGQVEGFTEKYGMEFVRAYRDETPRRDLVERHEREVFPLMHRRALFAGATSFRLFDLFDGNGDIAEDVFAFANQYDGDHALVLFNNHRESIAGWLHTSVPYRVNRNVPLRTEHLAQTLGAPRSWDQFVIFREQRSNLWFIRNAGELYERGLYVQLQGYECQVFLDFSIVQDNQFFHYARLADHLRGKGSPDMQHELRHLLLQPLHDAFSALANGGVIHRLYDSLTGSGAAIDWDSLTTSYRGFLGVAASFCDRPVATDNAVDTFRSLGTALDRLDHVTRRAPQELSDLVKNHIIAEREDASIFIALVLLLPLDAFVSEVSDVRTAGFQALDHTSEWQLLETLRPMINRVYPSSNIPPYWDRLVRVGLGHHNWWSYGGNYDTASRTLEITKVLFADPMLAAFIDINEYRGVTYFSREAFRLATDWLTVIAVWHGFAAEVGRGAGIRWNVLKPQLASIGTVYAAWQDAAETSGYRVDRFFAALGPDRTDSNLSVQHD